MKTIKFLFALLTAMFALAVQAQQGVDDAHRRHMEAFRHNESDLKFQEPSFSHLQAEDSELEMSQYANAESPKHAPTRRIQLDENNLLCDSTITFNGDGTYSYRYIYFYDITGKETGYEYSKWQDGKWVGSAKSEYVYDEHGNKIVVAYYNAFQDNEWIGYEKYEYTYDTNRNVVLKIHYTWKDSQWYMNNKSEYAFDEHGNQILSVSYRWHDDAWVGDGNKVVETFDDKNQILQRIYYTWKNGQWVGLNKYEYIRNTNSITTKTYIIKEDEWIESETAIKYVDTNGKVEKKWEVRYENWQNGQWQEKLETTYDYIKEEETSRARYKWEDGKILETWKEILTDTGEWSETKLEKWVEAKWIGEYSKTEIIYSDNGNTRASISYDWVNDDYWWDGEQERWVEGHWAISSKDETIFDEHNNSISIVHYKWLGREETWELLYPRTQWEYTYDDYGNILSKIEKDWNNKTSDWENTWKWEYTYYPNNYIASEARYIWENNQWKGSNKSEYSYDILGKINGEARYKWANNQWVGADVEGKWSPVYPKWERAYDDKGNEIRYAVYEWSNDRWVVSEETLNTYDENNFISSSISYQRINGELQGTGKYEYIRDDFGQVRNYISYTWSNGSWIGKNMYEYEYNELGYKTLDVFYLWQDDQWVVNKKTVYYYLDEPKESYTMKDLNKVVDILIGRESVEEEEMEKVDINGDGVISIGDVARVIYYFLKEKEDDDKEENE